MDENWRAAIALLPTFGPHGKLVFEYVEKFGVTPLGIKAAKVRRLLEYMARMFEIGRFDFKKKRYEISAKGIVEGLIATCNAHLNLPLTEHNYLKKILISIAEREQQEQVDKREEYLRSLEAGGSRLKAESSKEEEKISLKEFKQRKGLQSLAGCLKGFE